MTVRVTITVDVELPPMSDRALDNCVLHNARRAFHRERRKLISVESTTNGKTKTHLTG